jgi:hypothetical protein
MKIRLSKLHTHAGKEYQPGDEIDVNPRQADWLVSEGVAEEIGQEETTQKNNKEGGIRTWKKKKSTR